MAMTIAGFQGTVSETQWAQIMTAVAQKYTLTSGDPVRSSGRTLLIDPRASVGAGVLVVTDTLTSVTVPAPATGQWHLLVLRRTWGASRSAQYILIPGATGPNAAQTAPPTTLPAGRSSSVGVVDDEPVAWVYARSGTTELQLWQLSERVVEGTFTTALAGSVATASGWYYQDQTQVLFSTPFSRPPRLLFSTETPWGAVQVDQLFEVTGAGFRLRSIRLGAQPSPTKGSFRAIGPV